jgi:4-hydroxy-tetrahydrodipicolinate reductase
MELVGTYSRRAGLDLGEIADRTRPDVAIQATCSRLDDALGEIETLVRHGAHVISIAEEMAWPAAASPERAEHVDRLARDHAVSVLGTGINPGFVLDLLLIALTGVCSRIESIHARRVNDLSPYGPTVLTSQGVGLTPEAFQRGVEDGSVVGHVGFPESIRMIARAVGWKIERITETREPIVSRVERATPFVKVGPGQVAGCLHRAVAFAGGRVVVTLEHPQQVHPGLEGVETGDTLEIEGTPDVRLAGSPEIPGGIGTVALAVNSVPLVLAASPGLQSMADLPVPAALLGDARELLRGSRASRLRNGDA